MKNSVFTSSSRIFVSMTFATAASLASQSAQAASAAWNVDAAGNWNAAGSWDVNGIPGSTSSTVSADIATFGFTLTTADRIVTVDANRNIGGITFSNTSIRKYTLSGGNLLLSDTGVIQTASGNGNHTDTISSAIAIQGDGGSATFTAGATSTTSLLNIGAVTGVSTGPNTTTLTLNGTNTATGNVVTGIIGNGAAGGKLAIVKNDAGAWTLSGANTFTGGVTLNAGTLNINSASALGSAALGSGLIINGGAISSTTSGITTGAYAQTWNADFAFTGTQSLNLGTGAVNLGSVAGGTRTLTVSANALTIGGIISNGTNGITPTTSLVKAGFGGTLVLNGANTFGGVGSSFTLNTGGLTLGNANALGNINNTFIINGGTINAGTTPAAYAQSWGGNFAVNGNVNMGTGAVNLGGLSRTVTLNNITDIITIGGSITNGGITAGAGNGTMILAGANNYNGTTTVNANVTITGTNSGSGGYNLTATGKALRLGSGANGGLGSGTITTQNLSPTLRNDSGTAAVLTNALNNGGFTLAGADDITFNGNTTLPFSGQTTTNNSTATNGVTFAGTFALSSFGLAFAGPGKTTISGQITGSTGNLTYSGTNVLTLSGATSNYAGVTTINNGTVSVGSIKNYSAASNLGAPTSGSIVMGNAGTTGTLLYTGASDTSNRTIRIGTNSTTPAVTNIGGATIQNDGTGGALTFNAATFNTALGTASGVGADRVLTLQGSNIASNAISGIIQDNTISGTATGTSRIGVTKAGAGTWVLSGANIYSGNTSISAGTLRAGVANAIPSGNGKGNVVLDGGASVAGTFDINGFDVGINGLSGTTATVLGKVVNNATGTNKTLTVGNNDATATFAGVIADNTSGTGSVALNKTGTGTQTLSGINTYTGATTINGGILALASTGSISNTNGISLGTGGTLDVSAKGVGGYTVNNVTGSGDVIGSLTVSTQLAIGNSPGTTTFDTLTLGAASTYIYELTGGISPGDGSADLGIVSGDLTIISGAVLDLVQLGSYTAGNKFTLFAYTGTLSGIFKDTGAVDLIDGTTFTDALGLWSIDYNDTTAGLNGGITVGASYVTITAIPEPKAALLGGLGLLALLRRRRLV